MSSGRARREGASCTRGAERLERRLSVTEDKYPSWLRLQIGRKLVEESWIEGKALEDLALALGLDVATLEKWKRIAVEKDEQRRDKRK